LPPPRSIGGGAQIATAARAVAAPWNNCTQVHTRYAHGVGRAGAKDRVRGSTAPVTTFKRSTHLYNLAMRNNRDLDRDGDGVACEKR
jgi:Excalibur calcium-binding domain